MTALLLLSGTLAHASMTGGVKIATGPIALIRSGGTVWLADTDSNLLDTVTVDPAGAVIAHPHPGLVAFVGPRRIEHLDLATGDVTSLTNSGLMPSEPMADGQRIAVATERPPDPYCPTSLRAPQCEPAFGPDILVGLADVVSGDGVDIDTQFDNPTVAALADHALLVADRNGARLSVIRLDRPFELVELPTAQSADVLLADDGERIAVLASGELSVGSSGDELRVVASGVSELLGAVPHGVLVRRELRHSVVDMEGNATDLPPTVADAEVVGDSGLLRAELGERPLWFRVDAGAELARVHRAVGMELLAATDEAWWFVSGDAPAPFEGSPVIAIDPERLTVVDITGNLSMLGALAAAGTTSAGGRFLVAPFQESGGFMGLAVADADSGEVHNLDSLDQPLAFAPDAVHILSSSVQGATITTLGPANTLVNPVFEIELEHDDVIQYRWVTSVG